MTKVPTAVIATGGVNGDITSCKIENKLVKTQRESVLSITETNHYMSYDVCTKKVVEEYTIPEFTDFGLVSVIFAIMVIPIVLMAVFTDRYSY